MTETRDFALPDLGEGLEDGEIIEWQVATGDVVELNQIVVVVESAKAVVELPSPFGGVVLERVGEVGDTVEVGTVLLRIGTEPEPGASAADAPQTSAESPDPLTTEESGEAEPPPLVGYGQSKETKGRRSLLSDAAPGQGPDAVEPAGQARATPLVRKLAKDLGIDLSSVSGSGPSGRITRKDLEEAVRIPSAVAPPESGTTPMAPTQAPPVRRASIGFRGRYPGEVEHVVGIRKRIVEKMETSRRTIPDAGCARDTDFTQLMELSRTLTARAEGEGHQIRISPFVLICRASVLMLQRFPTLNSVYDHDAGVIRLLEHVNLGIAVDTPPGLLVANVKQAQSLSTLQLAASIDEVVSRCRDGKATPADLTGGTFTVNNYGYFGNDDGDPIINAPEAAIVGIGAIRPRPWVVDGSIVPRRVGRLTLSFDHRVCDGGDAGRAVTFLSELCENPAEMLIHA